MDVSYRTRRTVFDTAVVLTVAVSSFMTGVFHTIDMEATTAVVLPNLLLVALAFSHLVLRRGRKFDEKAHKKTVEALKALIFISFAASMYFTGLSTEALRPGSILSVLMSLVLTPVAVYVLAYLPHK